MTLPKLILLISLLHLTLSGYSQESVPPADTIAVITEKKYESAYITEAEFPGSFTGWRKYVEQNLSVDVPSKNDAPVGLYTVWVEFTVNSDGTLSDIKPLTNLGFGMEDEVIRLVKKSGNWIPGFKTDLTVKSTRKQHVTFMVTSDNYDIFSNDRYILFTGEDNWITVTASEVKKKHIKLSMSDGTLTKSGKGSFIVHLSKPGRMTIDIYDAKKKKPVGTVSFEVRERKKPGDLERIIPKDYHWHGP